eukprot:3856425-Rhodomonas_salina.2
MTREAPASSAIKLPWLGSAARSSRAPRGTAHAARCHARGSPRTCRRRGTPRAATAAGLVGARRARGEAAGEALCQQPGPGPGTTAKPSSQVAISGHVTRSSSASSAASTKSWTPKIAGAC